ncbi:MAG: RNA methyltransferase [Deltaproteobacteria bacterium]|nr:RNA methyltransferase [Deltaproteobacteria bacterium]
MNSPDDTPAQGRRVNMSHVSVVLARPRFPENIGSAARCAMNMGISSIIAVNPEDPDEDRMLKMATHKAAHLIRDMPVYDRLEDALEPFGYVVGTTARIGGVRWPLDSPREIAARLVGLSQTNRIALLFGSEDKGLTNDELRLCHALVNIPTADFSSLNLAQAVMVLSYELFTFRSMEPSPTGTRLASRKELEEMYDHLSEALIRIGFINPQNPAYWMMNVRRFFSRVQLLPREVKLVRGVCRQLNWYADQALKNKEAGGDYRPGGESAGSD